MGEAILKGLLSAKVLSASRITVSTRRTERVAWLHDTYGVQAAASNPAAAQGADVVILAVKPQKVMGILQDPELSQALRGRVVISICAGVTLEALSRALPESSLIRAMPNTPCLIGEGMTVLSAGPRATADEMAIAERIFSAIGRTRVLEEKHLDAVTALSGSGPAFGFVILESLADGGVMMGLPRDVAVELSAQMMQGAARLVLETGSHPAALKDDVTTPAGCTIAGLLTMEDGRVRSTLARAIQEATKVASSLGRSDGS